MPGRPTWPQISASEIRQRALSVPWTCCEMPMPQKMMPRWAVAKAGRRSRSVSASIPQTSAIASGGNALRCSFSVSKPSVWAWMYWLVVQVLLDDDVHASRSAAPRRCRA